MKRRPVSGLIDGFTVAVTPPPGMEPLSVYTAVVRIVCTINAGAVQVGAQIYPRGTLLVTGADFSTRSESITIRFRETIPRLASFKMGVYQAVSWPEWVLGNSARN